MTRIQHFQAAASEPPIPKPAELVLPHVVTVRDGLPIKFGDCDGLGVRIVHPTNPKAQTQAMGITMLYLPPHAELQPGSHWTEECYCILRGEGTMLLAGEKTPVHAGMFVHLPPWCEHGVENTGNEVMEILICTVPPNP